jgi:hypothetical protein
MHQFLNLSKRTSIATELFPGKKPSGDFPRRLIACEARGKTVEEIGAAQQDSITIGMPRTAS